MIFLSRQKRKIGGGTSTHKHAISRADDLLGLTRKGKKTIIMFHIARAENIKNKLCEKVGADCCRVYVGNELYEKRTA